VRHDDDGPSHEQAALSALAARLVESIGDALDALKDADPADLDVLADAAHTAYCLSLNAQTFDARVRRELSRTESD
jgi:hypothetical protein